MKSTVLSVLFGLSVLLSTCSGHGYIRHGRAHLCTAPESKNENCGAAHNEADSLASGLFFSPEGPKDGYIASGGVEKYHKLDEFGADRWALTPISAYVTNEKNGKLMVDFPWTLTVPRKSSSFQYFISKPTFDPTKPLTRDQLNLKPFCVDKPSWDTSLIGSYFTSGCILDPTGYSGHHVILGVWEVEGDTAFYQVIDVDFSTDVAPQQPTKESTPESADGTTSEQPTKESTPESADGTTSEQPTKENTPESEDGTEEKKNPESVSKTIEAPGPVDSLESDAATHLFSTWSCLAFALLFNIVFLMF